MVVTMILMLGFFVYMGAEMQNIQRFVYNHSPLYWHYGVFCARPCEPLRAKHRDSGDIHEAHA